MLLFDKEKKIVPPEFTRYMICKKMGWDYWTYMAQPSHFIQDILTCMEAEDTAKQIKNNQNQNE